MFVLSLFLLLCGCRPESSPGGPVDAARVAGHPVSRGPIVVITLSGLRPDTVGALGASPAVWTPSIDAFASEADWVGATVVASSAPPVSLTSLMTGVSPWHHQTLTHTKVSRRPAVPLLAEVLGAAGYRTAARIPLNFQIQKYGLLDGFDDVAEIKPIDRAISLFSELTEGKPELHWFHLPEASLDFERRDAELPRLVPSGELPHRIQAWRLLRYADPSLPLPADVRKMVWQLFCHEVAWADDRVGKILDALRASGWWDRAWVVLTASQGMELGEHSQMLYAQNLGRESIEVPLMIKLPQALRGSLAVTDDARVSQLRLWATLVEGVGEQAEPVRAPSLFRATTPPIASALYKRNGFNEFSLLKDDIQLLWSTRFAPVEPEFYRAQLAVGGGKPPLSEPAELILGRLETAFKKTLPLSGLGGSMAPRLRLERWTGTGVEAFEDRARAEQMALELRRQWMRHVDRERTPRQESSLSKASR